MDDTSAVLLDRWRGGDQQAAAALFNRYVQRLIAVARSHMSGRLAQRLDPEDVVQSAYRSFFLGARDGRYQIERAGELWRLLAAITLHKLHHQVERHTARKRGLDREQRLDGPAGPFGLETARLADEPSPAEAAALAEELEGVMRSLDPAAARVLELWLQGADLDEIASQVSRSQRTVRRTLEKIQGQLETALRETVAP